jgi:hypothetical protein
MGTFKDSVAEDDRHEAYFDIWRAMSRVQHEGGFKGAHSPNRRLS